MALSKMGRSTQTGGTEETMIEDGFDFGEPEILPVEISPGKFLYLKEPSANDLIEISKISENKSISEIEATLQTICILHNPQEGQKRLSLMNAKKLRAKQLRVLGEAIQTLLGLNNQEGEKEGDKS